MGTNCDDDAFRQSWLTAERQLLARALVDPNTLAKLRSKGPIEGFAIPLHRQIHDALLKCGRGRGQNGIDLGTVIEEVISPADAGFGVISEYVHALAEMGAMLPDEPIPDWHVRDFAIRIRLLEIGQKMSQDAVGDDDVSGAGLIERFEQCLYDLYWPANPGYLDRRDAQIAKHKLADAIEDIYDAGEGLSTKLVSPLSHHHFAPGRLVIILEDVDHLGLRHVGNLVGAGGIGHAGIFSLGQAPREVLHHMFAVLDPAQSRSHDDTIPTMEPARSKPDGPSGLGLSGLVIDDTYPLSESALRQRVRLWKRRDQIDTVVILEPARLIRCDGQAPRSTSASRLETLRDLKRLAVETGTGIIVIEAGAGAGDLDPLRAVDLVLDLRSMDQTHRIPD